MQPTRQATKWLDTGYGRQGPIVVELLFHALGRLRQARCSMYMDGRTEALLLHSLPSISSTYQNV